MAKDKIKILFYGDSPTVATGFGTVSRGILTNLYKTGKYDIKVMGINYWGDPHNFPFPIWPIGIGSMGPNNQPDPYGRRRSFDMMMSPENEFDILFMIQDSFILDYMTTPTPEGRRPLEALKAHKGIASVVYYPVDGVPKKEWIDSMAMHDKVVTYTNFARRESLIKRPDLEGKIDVIYHGVNPKNFHPISKQEVIDFRKHFFAAHAGKFIVTNLNRNQQRKDIPTTLLAFKEFKKLRPNSMIYLHMAQKDQGWDIVELCKSMNLQINGDVILPANFGPNQGFPIEYVNLIYNASDVVMSTTLGEGWGLSCTEAMACKRPVVFPNNTSLTEIIGSNNERGYLVPSGETVNDFVVFPHDNEVLRPVTSVEKMAETLVHVYDNPEEAASKAAAGYEWVLSSTLWDKHIAPKWDKVLTDVAYDVYKKKAGLSNSGVVSAEEI